MFKKLFIIIFISLISFNLFCAEESNNKIIIKKISDYNYIHLIVNSGSVFLCKVYKKKSITDNWIYSYISEKCTYPNDDQNDSEDDGSDYYTPIETIMLIMLKRNGSCYPHAIKGDYAKNKFEYIEKLYSNLPHSYKWVSPKSNPQEIKYSESIDESTLKAFTQKAIGYLQSY